MAFTLCGRAVSETISVRDGRGNNAGIAESGEDTGEKELFCGIFVYESYPAGDSLEKDRFAAPCGDWTKKQCPDGCEEGIGPLTEEDQETLQQWFEHLQKGEFSVPSLEKCPKCGKERVLNNVYAGRYDEKGYLENWTEYQKWLQNTLNHKMVLLEIGEGNRFPTIIRTPFERIALFQQKADLYYIEGEQNPIAWLLSLC